MQFRQLFLQLKPKWLWFGAYFAAIPLFAAVYGSFAEDFYEPNAVRELQAVALKRELEADLTKPVDDFFGTSRNKGTGADEFHNLTVYVLRCDDPSEISFVTPFEYSGTKTFAWQRYEPVWHVALPPLGTPDVPHGVMLTVEKLPLYAMALLNTHSGPTPGGGSTWGPIKSGVLDPADPAMHLVGNDLPYGSLRGRLTLPDATLQRIEDYQSVCLGSATPLKPNFLRFVYLSGATITTLGYGDIVPITERARGLVISEAVLGVFLIGLFLNSLADRAEGR